jgi:hypothetical protein
MHNEELRNRVLVRLYKKYYEDGFAHPMDIEEVLQDAGIPSENSNLAYTNVIYLEESSLIKGDKPLGTKYPKWISIKPYGIETVERKEKEFANLHNDIRFKILSNLYDYNFTDHEEHTIPVDINFTKSLGLNESYQNLVIGDINYLYDKGLIKGLRQIGVPYPSRVQITSKGIDAIESVINQSLIALRNQIRRKKREQKKLLMNQTSAASYKNSVIL